MSVAREGQPSGGPKGPSPRDFGDACTRTRAPGRCSRESGE
jgi:hypothetical protein